MVEGEAYMGIGRLLYQRWECIPLCRRWSVYRLDGWFNTRFLKLKVNNFLSCLFSILSLSGL